ncbi:dynein light chain Tctex-type 5-A [Astyanax mexicanus]|uniref:dynein light chain Tctex-type 5-A n=1 Tax=Astyanax mexicanus TaxID=7994 RepID=UPI0020CADA5A|nr:dynein light chain Tctex-type 5-A [Astyanax mexicanus]
MMPCNTHKTCFSKKRLGHGSQKRAEGQKSRVTTKADSDPKQQWSRTKKTTGFSQTPPNQQAVKTEMETPVPWTSSLTVYPGQSEWQEYQTAPHRRFPREQVHSVMKSIVEARLGEAQYTSSCSAVARELSDSIKEAAKSLSYERYKLISYVAIGQLRDSEVTCSSRGVWCPAADTFTEYTFKNDHLFALCVLFAVYQE